MLMQDLVLCSIDAGVATVTLNRPERMNAWTLTMEQQYFDTLEALDDDRSVRAVVLTGAGRGFCPGLDASELAEVSGRGDPTRPRVRPAYSAIWFRKPLVAAINGGCAGIGLLQALVCDVRFAAAEAKISTAVSRRGIVAEFGLSWMLTRIVGQGHASDLLLSARAFTGAEAAAIGLVNRAVVGAEVLTAAQTYARDLADNCSPLAMAAIKAQLLAEWSRSLAESSDDSQDLLRAGRFSADMQEGIASFVARRPPRFEGLPARVPADVG
jgi:enoyl-CoA hydratase/carnithine racemase